jgi:hypothetical protein
MTHPDDPGRSEMPGRAADADAQCRRPPAATRARRRAGWWLFATFACLYAAGMVRVDFDFAIDGAMRYETLHFLLEHGMATIPQLAEHDDKFFVGAVLAMAPLYLAGKLAQAVTGSAADLPLEFCLFFYQILTALGCLVLFRLCGALSDRHLGALAVAALYGLASMAWPYAVDTQSEPLVATSLLGSFYLLVRFRQDGRAASLVSAGLCEAVAILTRPEAAIHAVVLGGYLLHALRARATAPRPTLARAAAFTATAALGPLGALLWNYARYGSLWETGYGGETFATPLVLGLYGQLFSAGKGVFFYNPILVVALFGWTRFWRARTAEACVAFGIVLLGLLTYAKFWNWAGDASWGPRFLVTVLPFAMLPLAWVPWSRSRAAGRAAVLAIAALSVSVQMLGAFVPIRPDYAYKWDRQQVAIERALSIGRDDNVLVHFLPSYSPLWKHLKNFQGSRTSLRWFPYAAEGGRSTTPVGLVLVVLLGASSAMLARAARRLDGDGCRRSATATEPPPMAD